MKSRLSLLQAVPPQVWPRHGTNRDGSQFSQSYKSMTAVFALLRSRISRKRNFALLFFFPFIFFMFDASIIVPRRNTRRVPRDRSLVIIFLASNIDVYAWPFLGDRIGRFIYFWVTSLGADNFIEIYLLRAKLMKREEFAAGTKGICSSYTGRVVDKRRGGNKIAKGC